MAITISTAATDADAITNAINNGDFDASDVRASANAASKSSLINCWTALGKLLYDAGFVPYPQAVDSTR